MEEMGLAAQGSMPSVGQVVSMLRQGASPNELVQRGVPVELVQQAMEVIKRQTEVGPEQAGLAGMATQNTLMER